MASDAVIVDVLKGHPTHYRVVIAADGIETLARVRGKGHRGAQAAGTEWGGEPRDFAAAVTRCWYAA